jgi:flagellar hook assembly protein FlgD
MAILALNLDPRDSIVRSVRDSLMIVRYNTTTRQWTAYPTGRPGYYMVTATVPINGLYAVAVKEDHEGPEIKYSVEGQFYDDIGTTTPVPTDARFTAVVLDPAGVNTDLDKMILLLDGKPLRAGSDFVIVDSTITATTTNIRIQTNLEPGTHSLSLQIADKLGNMSGRTTTFEVERELALKVYGNFPNHFDKETSIAFEIRGATIVDEVEVKIYTTAGKAIKTMRFPSQIESEVVGLQQGGTGEPTSLGYHEAWWDGRDDQGNEVANGVYFYRIRVKNHGDVIEQTGVMARIR